MFPINVGVLPKIYVYEIETSENKNSISGKLAYRMKKEFKGHWASNYGRILTDTSVDEIRIDEFLKKLWQTKNILFNNVRNIKKIDEFKLSEYDIAAFVARGLLTDAQKDIIYNLNKDRIEIKNAIVKRVNEFGGYVVNKKAAVSISVSSNILLKQDLDYHIRNRINPVGLYVKVKHQPLKGEVSEVTGSLKDHRERLLTQAQDEESLRLIEEASDDTRVVTVRSGRNSYDYPANLLEIVLTLQNCSKFDVAPREISKYTKISPKDRSDMINLVRKLANEKIRNDQSLIEEAYDSKKNSDLFPHMFNLPFKEPVIVGNEQVCDFQRNNIMKGLRKYGLYKPSNILNDHIIRLGVLYPTDYDNKKTIVNFIDSVKRELSDLSFTMEITKFLKFDLNKISDMETKVDELKEERTDLILAFLPETRDEDDDFADVDIYHTFKQLTITKGIGGQVVNYDTLSNSYALFNIILGILGKTGNIPYTLSKPLEFCDVVVGIDIARARKRKLQGSNNAAAIARVYFNDGNFLKYVIHDAPLEGETVPPDVLRSLFPIEEFKGKRVVIHRDGYFRGEEVKTLESWGSSIGAEFSLIEVIKREAPRIYKQNTGNIESPEKGSVFQLNANQALVISSPPPFKNSTPRPLKVIKKSGNIDLTQAIRSVLSLTELHYGSLNPPRLPVTIHYSDQIAWFALRGIKPPTLIGEIPFWL